MLHDAICMEEKKMRIDDYVAEDRTNALPEAILHHIMSFLPFKQAVQTSVLSKTWCQAWLTFPDLVFDEALFPGDWHDYCRDQKRFAALLTYWERILHRRGKEKVSVRKFTLRMIFLNDLDLADRCVRHAIENNVREMIFEVSPRVSPHTGRPVYYSFPLEALSSNTLRAFTLRGACKLDSKLFPSNVNLSALSYLRLWRVLADEQALHNLLAGCPLIQDLEICFCRGIKSLKLLEVDIEMTNTNLVRATHGLQKNKDVNRCVFENDGIWKNDDIWRRLMALQIPESHAMF